MPRSKEYDHQDVLDAATSQFLDKGYKGVSVNDLVKATKLNKHSMYQEFGNKEGLFCACIDNYVQTVYRSFGHILRRHPLGLTNIDDFFRHRIDYAYSGKGNGCLLLTTVAEKEQVDKVVLDRVQHHWTLQKADFKLCLDAARERGDIPEHKDTDILSNHLFCQLIGMVIMIKGGTDRQTVEMMIDMILAHVRQ
ncbi:TetR/AcrR family transcriptional regulator [Desulfoluna spongiiphila]|uniref:Transcriptional regulator, TetR family n=1 Tax=Desulfoluna spongiiphila TaxID=419481 RepID=A0A1G5HZ57_9BACT|nr:TetR/AcrR family transcriptional regulator [Desulfoluna spongiiphila]SCY68981.1 transcriptional regulator, TetR family [Desulfoluna spongiiphila]VVS94940.1 dna-binding hth domain tetr-type [Desulfoluna spongiiphila]